MYIEGNLVDVATSFWRRSGGEVQKSIRVECLTFIDSEDFVAELCVW